MSVLDDGTYILKNQQRLRCGITTGTCAMAAAKAAALMLLLSIDSESVKVSLPSAERTIPVRRILSEADRAGYSVRKDSGDDPDVTDHAEIRVFVERMADDGRPKGKVFRDEAYPHLFLDGGIGVGRVTKEGLEQKIGYAAINARPRQMIFREVGEVCAASDYAGDLLITVCVPEGENLARKTFNPRLGIEGGISILGTTGILEPMSERAIVDTIRLEIEQRAAQGKQSLLLTPGNYGQRYLEEYLHLDIGESIKCSNYIGETLDLAVTCGIREVLLVGNIGKLVKLAAGIMNTHSKTADGRCEIFAAHTALCGGSREMTGQIMEAVSTEKMLGLLETWNLQEAVLESICQKIEVHLRRRIGDDMRFAVLLFSETYGLLGQAGDREVLHSYGIKWEEGQ